MAFRYHDQRLSSTALPRAPRPHLQHRTSGPQKLSDLVARNQEIQARLTPQIDLLQDSDETESNPESGAEDDSDFSDHARRKLKALDSTRLKSFGNPRPPVGRYTSTAYSSRLGSGQLRRPLQTLQGSNRQKVTGSMNKALPGGKSKPRQMNPNVSARLADRNEIKAHISNVTMRKRANFFVANRELFLPLLPELNYVRHLTNQRRIAGTLDQDLSVPYELLPEQPEKVKATMKPYQLRGLSFLIYMHRNGISGILGDEMGLGKTLQTLSLVQYLKNTKDRKKSHRDTVAQPSLVVCPLSVLNSWINEAKKWTPDLKVLRFHGPASERDRMKKLISSDRDVLSRQSNGRNASSQDGSEDELSNVKPGVDLVVTTYEGFLAEQNWFKRALIWNYVILDEGHKIKNEMSLVAKALQGLSTEYRLILTGTPLQNNLKELWALLHWLYPDVFSERSQGLFKDSFDLTKGQVSTRVMDDARRLLEVVMLRRMKDSPGVDLSLPPKTDVLLYVPLTPMQRFWYLRLLTKADKGLLSELFEDAPQKEEEQRQIESEDHEITRFPSTLSGDASNKSTTAVEWSETKQIMRQAIEREETEGHKSHSWRRLMNLLMQLRKCCNHPYILPHAAPDPYYLGEHVIHASAKFIVLDKLLDELVIKQKKKIIIFSCFTSMLDSCEDMLALRGGDGEKFRYVRLDGSTSRARRNLNVRLFNQEGNDHRVILISTKAGGLGINLTAASEVILLDQDWNPQIMLQAEARAHRIGQTKPVTIYKLCTQGTVEEQMLGRINKKLYLSAKVTESMRDLHFTQPGSKAGSGSGSGQNELESPQLNTGQLMSLVRRGAQTLAHPQINIDEMRGWDWETMLEKCKDRPADGLISGATDATDKTDDEAKWLSQMEQVQSTIFDGKKHQALTSNADIREEWSKEERREGKNTTVLVDGYAVSKQSMSCGDWEAVPTMAGDDARWAEPTRPKRAPLNNQEHCQICWDSGDLKNCRLCPRSFHLSCLPGNGQPYLGMNGQFSCPQHECHDCEQKTQNAGGMLFRCRWCERSYCEDCLNWERTELLGENLKEYELLAFSAVAQAYYIDCPACIEERDNDTQAKEFCERTSREIDARYERRVADEEARSEDSSRSSVLSSPAGDLTEGLTLESSGISTPGAIVSTISSKKGELKDGRLAFATLKRKLNEESKHDLAQDKRLRIEGEELYD